MSNHNVTKSGLSGEVLLLLLLDPPNEEWIAGLRTKYPGLEVRWAMASVGGKLVPPTAHPAELWDGVTLLMNPRETPPAELVKSVRYIQIPSSGMDRWHSHPTFKDPNVMFVNARGVGGPQIAEWVMGTWLAHGHYFYKYYELKKKGIWEKWTEANPSVHDSPGQRVGVLGYGAIGWQVGRIAKALGMEVYVYTRSERSTPESRRDPDYIVPGTGDLEGTVPDRWFHGESKEAIREFLAQDLDLLVVSLPLNESTRNIISHDEFEILAKNKTFVSNIARGPLINTQALIDSLEKGKIRGAALDVTDPEPLTQGHPLWEAPNLFISPHVSWDSDKFNSRVLQILDINLERLSEGKQPINLVKKNFTSTKDGNKL